MNKRDYLLLKNATTKTDLANILGISTSFLTRILYKPNLTEGQKINYDQAIAKHYHQFNIAKRSGGIRTIYAPSQELKDIQHRLSVLLQNCTEVIRSENNIKIDCQVSHGFERKRSIITNALMHKDKKNILNLDLENFFGSINFGRVRGFFISNKNYQLNPMIATVIAQIACYNNSLPQGSPCSPVIANLIASSLDIKLLKIAQKSGCSYSRYADDITFSTRKKSFPSALIKQTHPLELSKSLLREIKRAGFSVNPKKTRLQYKNSRQEVTGLLTNKKINIKSEYWRLTRAMAHKQFKSGTFVITNNDGSTREGTLNELEGRLAFIDSIDYHNNIEKSKLPRTSLKKTTGLNGFKEKLNSREITYSRFLFYKNFHANEYPTILTEGKTDIIYLKSALSQLKSTYPNLVENNAPTRLKLKFLNLNKKTAYFLDLVEGTASLFRFVQRYKVEKKYFYESKGKSPVILILDNDQGPNALLNYLINKIFPNQRTVLEIRNSGFLHIFENLYLILTPLKTENSFSEMEDLFDPNTLSTKISGKTFSPNENADKSKFYGKHIFSTKVISQKKEAINFDKFKYIFDEIEKVNQHFSSL